jgi:hypothetical protein
MNLFNITDKVVFAILMLIVGLLSALKIIK